MADISSLIASRLTKTFYGSCAFSVIVLLGLPSLAIPARQLHSSSIKQGHSFQKELQLAMLSVPYPDNMVSLYADTPSVTEKKQTPTLKHSTLTASKKTYADLGSSGSSNDGKRSGGGPRGECEVESKPQALVPPTGLGMTTTGQAMAWLHIPFSAKEFHSIRVVFEDPTNPTDPLYSGTILSTSQTPGIVGIELPKVTPAAIDRAYEFKVSIHCEDPATNGAGRFKMAWKLQPTQEPFTWQDDLNQFGKQQCEHKGNRREWQEHLKIAGFEDLSAQPVYCLKAPTS